jgi:hypothetical protein
MTRPSTMDPATTAPAFPANPFAGETDDDVAAGTYAAQCIDYKVRPNVLITKWQSTQLETADFVAFLFELKLPDGSRRHVATKLMRISMSDLSNLCHFLLDWQGEPLSEPFTHRRNMWGKGPKSVSTSCPSKRSPDRFYPRIMHIARMENVPGSGRTAGMNGPLAPWAIADLARSGISPEGRSQGRHVRGWARMKPTRFSDSACATPWPRTPSHFWSRAPAGP